MSRRTLSTVTRRMQTNKGGIQKKKKKTEKRPQKSDDKQTMPDQPAKKNDFLSYCPNLNKILSYVNAIELVRCLKVNRKFYNVINSNRSMMAKPTCNIEIENEEDEDCVIVKFVNVDEDEMMLCHFNAKAKTMKGYTVIPGLADFLASKARGFKVLKDRSITYTVDSQAQAIHAIFQYLLPLIEIKEFRVIETHPISVQPLILNCLQEYFKPQKMDISLEFVGKCNAIQTEICRILGCERYRLDKSQIDDAFNASLLRLDHNLGSVDIYKNRTRLGELHGFLAEWAEGKRDFTFVNIISWFPTDLWEKLSVMPEFRLESVDELHLTRASDEKVLCVQRISFCNVLLKL